MARRSKAQNPESLRKRLIELLTHFEEHLRDSDLRTQVLELVPANHMLRDLGISLVGLEDLDNARDRILLYLRKHVGMVIHGDEIYVVAGISEYARRVRELRVEFGWMILSGVTVKEMRQNAREEDSDELDLIESMKPDEYVLAKADQDKEAAFRWRVANEIRKKSGMSIRDKILTFLRQNVGKEVSGEELRYVAGNKSEWARRTRELRTEDGWSIVTKTNGRPDLAVGVYILERDVQSPPHDRSFKDNVRRRVLQRDNYTCQNPDCGWNREMWDPSDPRHLEVHHIQHHAKGGSNEADNLVTYCNICHDEVHRKEGSVES